MYRLSLKQSFNRICCCISFRVDAKLARFDVNGMPNANGTVPTLAASQTVLHNEVMSLLNLVFETNPIDGECDQRVSLQARPLEIIYDAVRIFTYNTIPKQYKHFI